MSKFDSKEAWRRELGRLTAVVTRKRQLVRSAGMPGVNPFERDRIYREAREAEDALAQHYRIEPHYGSSQ